MQFKLLPALLAGFLLCSSAMAMDPALIDSTIPQGEDFYRFACDRWLDSTPLPPSTQRFNTFSLMRDFVDQQLITSLKQAKSRTSVSGNTYFLGVLFESGLLQDSVGAKATGSMQDELQHLRSQPDMNSLASYVAHLHRYGFSPLFRIHEPARWELRSRPETLFLHQAGLGLPEPETYLNDDDRSGEVRENYLSHIANMFVLAGDSPQRAKMDADRVLKLETAIAAIWSPRPASPHQYFNLKNSQWLENATPSFTWDSWFQELSIPEQEQIIIGEPDYFLSLERLITSYDLETWKAYLSWHLLTNLASALPEHYRDEQTHFNHSLPNARFKSFSNEKRVLVCMTKSIPEAVDQFYLNEFYTDSIRVSVEELVVSLQSAMRQKLSSADWMSGFGRKVALRKLETMKVKLGGTQTRTDFRSLALDSLDFAGNILQVRQFHLDSFLARLGKPWDEDTWGHYSFSLYLAYDLNHNSIAIDASNFQPLFFSPDMDIAERYAWLGTTIAHEMGHAFDEQAHLYNAKGQPLGRIARWRLGKRFAQKIKALQQQYDSYEALPGVFVNGTATSIEAFADHFGVEIAFEAFQQELQREDVATIPRYGYTAEQRFFISYAQVWKEVISTEAQTRQAQGPHPPTNIRAIAPLRNMDDFYKAFVIKPDDQMYLKPSARVHFW